MKFVVTNCFHWVGYHLVDLLLENGHQVSGIDQLNTRKKEALAMFVERNSLFLLGGKKREDFDIHIEIDESKDNVFLKIQENKTDYLVTFPCLIGEWMPEMRVRSLKEQWNNDERNECLYVREVLSIIIYWLENKVIFPEKTQIYSVNSDHKEKIIRNNVLFKSNQLIDDYIEKVVNHYLTYQKLY